MQASGHSPQEFDAMYAGTPPWDIGRPQPAFLELARAGELRGRVLDVGCGTGEHALLAAGLGLEATGVDTDRQPGELGPRRITQDEIRTSFRDGWRVDSIVPKSMDVTLDPHGAQAWLAAITRTGA